MSMDLQNHAKDAAEQSQHLALKTSTTRVRELLIPINKYRNSLLSRIDALEWVGKYGQADFYKKELKNVEQLIEKGETFYCLH